jgi:DNA-directed RNA polymerase
LRAGILREEDFRLDHEDDFRTANVVRRNHPQALKRAAVHRNVREEEAAESVTHGRDSQGTSGRHKQLGRGQVVVGSNGRTYQRLDVLNQARCIRTRCWGSRNAVQDASRRDIRDCGSSTEERRIDALSRSLEQVRLYQCFSGRIRESDIRGTPRPIESQPVVDALNALQGTAFRVNRRVLEIAETFKMNAEDLKGGMVLGRYVEARHDATETKQRAKMIRSALTVSAMRELQDADEFYFPWNLDWRGRMYPATTIISPQGADLCKGCLEFADGTPLGPDGSKWLAIHLCNLAGADKEVVDGAYRTRTPDERVAWTLKHGEEILAIAADPRGNRAWHLVGGLGLEKLKGGRCVPVAVDQPWQFLAACFEWAEFTEQGSGFKSRLAGALDGSCSGVQMLAGMTRDESAGRMVNLVPAPRGDDYYARMAEALSKRLCNLVDSADPQQLEHLRFWSEQTIDRDLLKAPSMTKVYSAGTYTFGEQVRDKTGAPEAESMWLAAQINACFEDVAPAMLRAMAYLQDVADVMTGAGIPLYWKTPAGLGVEQARMGSETTFLCTQIGGPQTRRRRAFTLPGETLSKKDQRAGVAPNFVHGVDAAHMVLTVNDLYAGGVRNFWMIHDSFGAPFARCQEVFDSTRQQFVELMSPDLLRRWTEDVTEMLPEALKEKLPELPEYGKLYLSAVRDSTYAWF